MTQETNNEMAVCKSCGRTLDDGGQFGLCPACVNKFGSPLIAGGALAVGYAIKKFGPRAAKFLFALIKR